ncbi:hypothetical protein D0Z07_1855 [Hyphodiscus hymeniophilus]|uniref:Glycosyltransferase family 92 protein n=1 Tax=Hyphodiscus hymeniophilus TaxID=353542 RepID=A0A9P6VP11_9HELO|nr:hypothetical protein D0Z07_1855 [Hyphodiscus hymeniophilus]
MQYTELIEAVHWIQWKPVFILTICLMALQTLFFHSNDLIPTVSQSAMPSALPKPNPNSLLLPDIQTDNDPLVVEGPEDHDFPPDGAPTPYIAVCMAVRNQARDLREFLVHHYYHIGIRRFYIMDDNSEPPLDTFEYPGVPQSVITIVRQDPASRVGGHSEQLAIYARCMASYGHLHTWMAFLDADEYLEMTSNDTLRDILEEFEEDASVGALAVNWRMHSSSGVLKRPQSARKSFVDCITDETDDYGRPSDNQHVKVIVRTSYAQSPLGPHMWRLNQGHVVGEHGDIIASEAWRNPITRDRIALHHYAVKSREEYEEKMFRGNAMDDPKGESFWDVIEKVYPHVKCPEMAKYDP